MVAGEPPGANRHWYWLLETYHQIPALWTCVIKHLGIVILLYRLRNSPLDSSAPFYLLVFIPYRLDSLLPERHSVPSSICKEEVATSEHVSV